MQITDLMGRPQSREHLAEWYASVLEDQRTSGLSVAEYADQIGISAGTLYEWRRRLSQQEPDLPSRLIEVALDTAVEREPSPGFTLRLGRDRSIEVPADFDDTVLARLVATLESC